MQKQPVPDLAPELDDEAFAHMIASEVDREIDRRHAIKELKAIARGRRSSVREVVNLARKC